MSSTSTLADYLRSNFSGEAWQVTHVDDVDRKVYVEAPRAIVNLSEALTEIQEETGATCDLELTSDGATLTFWSPVTWDKPTPPTSSGPWWVGVAFAAAAVVIAGAAVVVSPHTTHNFSRAESNESREQWWSIW